MESSTRFRRARRDLPGVGVSAFINIFRYNEIFLNGLNVSHLCLKCEFLSEHKCSEVLEEAVRSVVDDELVTLVAVHRQLAGLHAHKVTLVLLLNHGIMEKLDIKTQYEGMADLMHEAVSLDVSAAVEGAASDAQPHGLARAALRAR